MKKIEVIEWFGYYKGEEIPDCNGDYWGVDILK